MKHLMGHQRTHPFEGDEYPTPEADDPMSSIANLLDIFLVFIVALLVSFLSAYHLQDLLSPDKSVTIMTQSPDGNMTLVTKKAQKIEAVKISKTEAEGKGVRLGVAYRLEDGSMVYLPDK
ncbi:MAG: DUF2149 domain-containing protein [Synergistaceae bacterium]|jgi:hypothetical protein|nr:DUF2149 domain-containing protein [Synergistaceae bacterium]